MLKQCILNAKVVRGMIKVSDQFEIEEEVGM